MHIKADMEKETTGAAPLYTALITVAANLVFGNLILAWVPLAAIRFNYTFAGMGVPVSLVALFLLAVAFWMIRPSSGGWQLIGLGVLSAGLVPVLGVCVWFLPCLLSDADSFGEVALQLSRCARMGLIFSPLALPFALGNSIVFFRYRRRLKRELLLAEQF